MTESPPPSRPFGQPFQQPVEIVISVENNGSPSTETPGHSAYLLDRMWEAAATDHPSLESMWEAAGSSTVAISNHTSTRTLLSSMPDDSDEKWRAMKRRLPGPSSVEQIPAFSPTLLPQISIDEIEASSSAEDETDLRRVWITYYWSAGEIERAYELGCSGEWERRNGGLMPVIGDPRDDAVHEAIRTADRKLLQVPKVAVSPNGATWAVEQQTASSPPHFVPGVSGAGVLREGRCSSSMLSWPPSAAAMNSMAIVDVGRPSSSAVTTTSRVEDNGDDSTKCCNRNRSVLTMASAVAALLAAIGLVAICVVLFFLTTPPERRQLPATMDAVGDLGSGS